MTIVRYDIFGNMYSEETIDDAPGTVTIEVAVGLGKKSVADCLKEIISQLEDGKMPHEIGTDRAALVASHLPPYWCRACGKYFDSFHWETIPGNTGHPDNWSPDEHTNQCPECLAYNTVERTPKL